ncbi:tautomerase PptA [Serratia sp. NPDC078593]|uniref:tautomerase PptA n=1 Tax=unclassified Serratia (in: enterobacteria) TaxID=2647522 RepID=UPI0037D2C81A
MPHVKIQHFPVSLSETAQHTLAEDIAQAITRAFGCRANVVSIALEAVSPDDWQEQVYRPEIENKKDGLIKQPNY